MYTYTYSRGGGVAASPSPVVYLWDTPRPVFHMRRILKTS